MLFAIFISYFMLNLTFYGQNVYIQMKKQGQLTNQIKKLQYQLSYSEHINKQLSVQLAALCTKIGVAPSKFKQTSQIGILNSLSHLQELYYVEPLIMCYEENIHLLKSQLEEMKQQSKSIVTNVEKIANENSFLRKQLQSKIELLTKADNLGINVNFITLQNKDLKDKIEILNAKNQYLVRNIKQISLQNEKVTSQNLTLFDKNELSKIQKKGKEDLKMKETQILRYKSQIQILKNKLENQENMGVQSGRKISQLDNQIIRLKNEVKVTRQQLQNNELVQEKIKQNLQIQLITIKEQLVSSQKKQQQLFTKCMALQSELQDKNNKIHNINLQNSQLQTNNNNMLQMLENYEVKVSTLTKKNKKFESELKQNTDQKADLSKRAEISEWKLAQKVEQLERKQNEWKKEKSRIGKMWEQRLEAMRKGYQSQITSSSAKQ